MHELTRSSEGRWPAWWSLCRYVHTNSVQITFPHLPDSHAHYFTTMTYSSTETTTLINARPIARLHASLNTRPRRVAGFQSHVAFLVGKARQIFMLCDVNADNSSVHQGSSSSTKATLKSAVPSALTIRILSRPRRSHRDIALRPSASRTRAGDFFTLVHIRLFRVRKYEDGDVYCEER